MIEADVMLLEEYLDGELSAADGRAVEERCAHEPSLAAELHRLRSDRQIRLQAWRTMEGDERAVERVATRVGASIQRRESFAFLLRGLRFGAAAAACIVLGLTLGFFVRSGSVLHAPGTEAINTTNQTPLPGKIASAGNPAARGYDVNLKDETGKVVAVQHFSNLEQARQFVQDVGQWQQRQEQMHNGNVNLVSEEYY